MPRILNCWRMLQKLQKSTHIANFGENFSRDHASGSMLIAVYCTCTFQQIFILAFHCRLNQFRQWKLPVAMLSKLFN